MTGRRVTTALAAGVLALAGCGGATGAEEAPPPGAADGGLSGPLTVFAAASLTDAFTELGDRLTAEHPELEVRFNFAGSSALAQQVLQGAPADVLASADEAQMARVAEAGLAGEPEVFAANRLMLAVPRENPAGLEPPGSAGIPGLAELLDADADADADAAGDDADSPADDLLLAVCAPEVPCGVAAAQALEIAGASTVPDTYEDDVRGVLTKVRLGEVDAGLVYRSDVVSAGDDVLAYAFREAEAVRNNYPVAVLVGAPNPAAAEAFTDLVLSAEGQQVLADAGLLAP